MNWLEFITQIVTLLAILYGIDVWRREHIGKRQIELAEDTLTFFYEAVDAIKSVRCEVSLSNETENVVKDENESDKEFQARKAASVVYCRFNQYQELFSKLHALRYRFMAQIGKGKAKPFDELRQVRSEILSSARRLARLWSRDHFRTDKEWQNHQAKIEKWEAVFWECEDENDPVNPKLEKIIEDIEKTCKSTIAGKGTLYGFLNRKL